MDRRGGEFGAETMQGCGNFETMDWVGLEDLWGRNRGRANQANPYRQRHAGRRRLGPCLGPFPCSFAASGYHMSYVFFGHVVFYNVQIEKSN